MITVQPYQVHIRKPGISYSMKYRSSQISFSVQGDSTVEILNGEYFII